MPLLKPLFAATLFLSAFLLFSVQPMVGKALLPVMGGSPSIWNTAMVFFQVLLLGGYLYAFLISKIHSLKVQGAVHGAAIITAALISLPLSLRITEEFATSSPMSWQLGIMCAMVAAPFFILAASAPLLQRWFSLSPDLKAQSPYSLYVASNAGSLLALLAYPVLVERFFGLGMQAKLWSWGYAGLAILIGIAFISAGFIRKNIVLTATTTAEKTAGIRWNQRFIWIFLSFVPSSLMLGYTTYVTTDVTSLPLFWIIPLALYLISFIIAFSDKPLIPLITTRGLHAMFLLFFLCFVMINVGPTRLPILLVHGGLFFFTALLCHQELAKLKPSPLHLTEFYLFLSLGGALGGMFNSLLAPLIFPLPYEYLIAIILGAFARFSGDGQPFAGAWMHAKASLHKNSKTGILDFFFFPGLIIMGAFTAIITTVSLNMTLAALVALCAFKIHDRRWSFAITIMAITLCKPIIPWHSMANKLLVERNFYGIHIVEDTPAIRKLMHGTTVHGAQARGTPLETVPISYYYMGSGAEDAFALLDRLDGPQHIAALGMGVGTISCFRKGGRRFDFYEIDPEIVSIAQNPDYFTYLDKCKSKYRVILGDARQKIAEAPDHVYDMIFVDVFSSDNIPIHVVTREAVSLYLQKLKPDGLIVFHTSNRYFNLEPEIAAIARDLNLPFLFKVAPGGKIMGTEVPSYPTKYVALSSNPDILRSLITQKWGTLPFDVNQESWSDDYANVLRALRF